MHERRLGICGWHLEEIDKEIGRWRMQIFPFSTSYPGQWDSGVDCCIDRMIPRIQPITSHIHPEMEKQCTSPS